MLGCSPANGHRIKRFKMATIGIPPNGFSGAAQQTPAVRQHISNHSSKTLGHTKSRKRKRTKSGKSAAPRKPSRRKASGGSGAVILKAGTAAAKAWGAKMKRLRKKKAGA
jgi:hypothetical protein